MYIVLSTVIIVKGEHWAVTQKNIKCDMDALCVFFVLLLIFHLQICNDYRNTLWSEWTFEAPLPDSLIW